MVGSFSVITAEDSVSLQPQVIPVEVNHARKQLGSISMPFGSAWCDGSPAYWLIGHQPGDTERPWCLVTDSGETDFSDYDYTDSKWQLSSNTVMDRQDPLNMQDDGLRNMDRHDCVVMDVNFDGHADDVVCGVGAEKGTGYGYNEVYITQPETGVLVKALENHGLNRWPTMRNRKMITLTAADGLPLVMLATKGVRRSDGEPNIHRMFKLSPNSNKEHGFFFSPIPGPWTRYSQVTCLHSVDLNQDGLDDVLMCQDNKVGRVFLQNKDGTFSQVPWVGPRTMDWREARITDVTGDGIVDLIVVGDKGKFFNEPMSYVRVFQGTGLEPFFDFSEQGIWYERWMPFATPDVEIVDANHDGVPDIYVVLTDEVDIGTYCGRRFNKTAWWGTTSPQPSPTFVPPVDNAPDLLLVGTGQDSKFTEVWMDHAIPGCGSLIEPFGNNYTMILSHGRMARPGHSVLLQWYPE